MTKMTKKKNVSFDGSAEDSVVVCCCFYFSTLKGIRKLLRFDGFDLRHGENVMFKVGVSKFMPLFFHIFFFCCCYTFSQSCFPSRVKKQKR